MVKENERKICANEEGNRNLIQECLKGYLNNKLEHRRISL